VTALFHIDNWSLCAAMTENDPRPVEPQFDLHFLLGTSWHCHDHQHRNAPII